MTSRKWILLSIVLLMLLTCAVGCTKSGANLAPVSGQVTLNGQPLANADITFQPEGSKSPSSARTDKDGRYQLGYKRGRAGGTIGKNTVRIVVSPEVVKNAPRIAAKFNTHSELEREVTSGNNSFNFDVTAEGK